MAVILNKDLLKPNKKRLIVEIEVENDVQAYQAVSELAFSHKVKSAQFGKVKEDFNEINTPFHFLKDNKKNKKSFRDIRAERLK